MKHALLPVLLALSLVSHAQEPPPATPAPGTPGTPQPGAPQPGAQQPSTNPDGTYTIRRTTRLVVLDVVVTDKKGNLVPGLKRDDFHVSEMNEPQTIQNFEVPGARALPADVTINSTAELDQLAPRAPVNIILLDEFNTRFEDEAFARYSLKKFYEKQPDKLTIPTMLVAVDLQHFTVLHDYTQDKQAIVSSLDHHLQAYPWQAQQYSWIGERYATAFLTLTRVADATVGHLGHKNMIWIGRGFPATFRNASIDNDERVQNAVQNCVNALRDARVTLNTIDPAGLQVYNTYGSAAEFNDPFGGNYQFNALAKATGGRSIYGRNDVDAQILDDARDGESFYTVTYHPTNASNDTKQFRRIKITFDNPDYVATTRQGYYISRRPARVDPQNPSKRLKTELVLARDSTMVYDGVPLTLTPDATDPNHYTIHIGERSLAWTNATDTDPRHTEVIIMVTTFDKKGKEIKEVARNIKASAPPTVAPTGRLDRALDLGYKIDADPKAVRARFVIRVASSGRIGTADVLLGSHQVVSSMPNPPQAQTPPAQPTPPATPPTP